MTPPRLCALQSVTCDGSLKLLPAPAFLGVVVTICLQPHSGSVWAVTTSDACVQAEKLSESQLYSLGLLLLYWTTGIYIPGGAIQLVLELPNSRQALNGLRQSIAQLLKHCKS